MTYAEAYGRNERLPVDRVLRREGHPLGVRRAEATKAAVEEPEASQSHKRWTLGVAAGALLMAGTFAAGALGLHGGATPTAGSAPEHAPASPGHTPGDSGPVVGAPVPGQDGKQQDQQAKPEQQQTQPTTPASAGTKAQGTPAPNTGTGGAGSTGGSASGGSNQRGTTPSTSTPAPTTPTTQTPPPTTTQPAPPPSNDNGGLLGTVGDVLSPVTDVVGGILSPSSATTTTKSAPAGPALTMIDPLGDLVGAG